MADISLNTALRNYDRYLRNLFGAENKKVPQRVKTKVRRRAKGRCEWRRCRKRLKRGEYHHWRDPPTSSSTALLCHEHHKQGHIWKVEYDPITGRPSPKMIGRRKIPIPKRTRPKTTKTRRRRRKKS